MCSLMTYRRYEGNEMAKLVWTKRGVTQNETGSMVQIKIKLDSWLKCFELPVSCGGKRVEQLELL